MIDFFALIIGTIFCSVIMSFIAFQPMLGLNRYSIAQKSKPAGLMICDFIGLAIMFQIGFAFYPMVPELSGMELSGAGIFMASVFTIAFWFLGVYLVNQMKVMQASKRLTFYLFSLPVGFLVGPCTFAPVWYFFKLMLAPPTTGEGTAADVLGILAFLIVGMTVFFTCIVRMSIQWIVSRYHY